MGEKMTVAGSEAVAIGAHCRALGFQAVAIGRGRQAIGDRAVTIGRLRFHHRGGFIWRTFYRFVRDPFVSQAIYGWLCRREGKRGG